MMKSKKDILKLRNFRIKGLNGYIEAKESSKDNIVRNHLSVIIDREEFIIKDLNYILDFELDDFKIKDLGDEWIND